MTSIVVYHQTAPQPLCLVWRYLGGDWNRTYRFLSSWEGERRYLLDMGFAQC